MSQLQSEKFNIAWFKLAEFVARKEKERALGMYRLLVHSLPEEAIAAQLEGDLLLAFNDERALDCYTKAAELYEHGNNPIKAAAVYEHCLTLVPTSLNHMLRLARLYAQTDNTRNTMQWLFKVFHLLAAQNRVQLFFTYIDDPEFRIDESQKIELHDFMVIELLKNRPLDTTCKDALATLLEIYAKETDKPHLSRFIHKLSLLSSDAHSYALDYLKHEKRDDKRKDVS